MALLERPVIGPEADAEALFKEARRRRRRRWALGCALGLVLAVVAALVGIGTTRGSAPPAAPPAKAVATAPNGPPPTVHLNAFEGEGRLAFVSRGALWVMDGESHSLHAVSLPPGVVPLAPTYSPDRRWLAFTTTSGPQMQGYSLWMAAADGSHAHRVLAITVGGDAFGWSPRADLYAVAAGPVSKRVPFGQPTSVRLVSPGGRLRTLVPKVPAVVGAAWSPNGSELAVATEGYGLNTTLSSYEVSTGRRTVWERGTDGRQAFIVPAGWWTSWGIVYTVINNGAVPDGEGSFEDAAVYAISGPGAQPQFLGKTLTNDSDGAPTGTPSGDFSFVNDGGNDPRVVWDGKQSVVCLASSHTCAPVPAPAQDDTEDPAWNPSGTVLAYVVAPQLSPDEGFPQSVVSAWYAAHSLVLYDPGTHTSTAVTAPGATVPLWSSDGSRLLYEADDALWLTSPSGQPVEVASPIFGQSSPLSYYGEIDWAQQFGWSAAAPTTASCYVVCDPQI